MRILFFSACLLTTLAMADHSHAKDYSFTRSISSPIQETIPLVAKVSPRQASEVQAPRDGVIKEIYAWPGEVVGDSAPLLKLDDTELQMERKRLESERSEYTRHLRRIENLVEKDMVSEEVWDKNLQKLAQIRAELAIVEEKLENSTVRAPERGTIIWSDLKVGQEIKGAEPIYWIGDGEKLWLSAYIDEERSTGLAEEDIVAIFMDESSSPILGNIDFISFGGPQGGNVNLYVNAPRIGEIARKDEMNILVPIPSDKERVLLPESALTEDGYMYIMGPFGAREPDKYIISRFRPDIEKTENGVIYVNNLQEGMLVLANPSAEVKHRDVITAYEMSEQEWASAYASAVLKNENTSDCGKDGASATSGGSCGGGCGAAGGQVASTDDPEQQVCLVPADMFEKPELVMADEVQPEDVMPDQRPPALDPNGELPFSEPTAIETP